MIAAGVGLNDAGIDREALTLDEPRIHARTHHSFEDLAQNVAVPEATHESVDRAAASEVRHIEALIRANSLRQLGQLVLLDVDAFNAIHGVTGPQRDAMLAGCLLGFEVRGADPMNYLDESS